MTCDDNLFALGLGGIFVVVLLLGFIPGCVYGENRIKDAYADKALLLEAAFRSLEPVTDKISTSLLEERVKHDFREDILEEIED